jgi:hypothetical protein
MTRRSTLRERLLYALPILLLLAAGTLGASLLFGDGCGPVERTARALVNGWDMWDTAMVRPFEPPLTGLPSGVVTFEEPLDALAAAQGEAARLPEAARGPLAERAYRRYCRHCHGTNGDGRIIVGESFAFPLPDLRGAATQELGDDDLFELVGAGSGRMIGLADTLTPLERLLSVWHLRTLKDHPSVPFYPPRWLEPAARPGGTPASDR